MNVAILKLFTRPIWDQFLDPRLVKSILGIAIFTIVCLTVAHGCHFGGHDLDLEP